MGSMETPSSSSCSQFSWLDVGGFYLKTYLCAIIHGKAFSTSFDISLNVIFQNHFTVSIQPFDYDVFSLVSHYINLAWNLINLNLLSTTNLQTLINSWFAFYFLSFLLSFFFILLVDKFHWSVFKFKWLILFQQCPVYC